MTNLFGFLWGLSALCGIALMPFAGRLAKTKRGRQLMFAPVAAFFFFFLLTMWTAPR